ncbi:MAG TPA: response regulator [Chitinivibrionales bacterium]|nr:response regulator [Chitinivibrionales bacterium]
MASLPNEADRRILIVDDEADVLDFLKIYLESLGWKTTLASSTAEAFSQLEQGSFFLILTDIAMPDMDGYEFIGKLREKGVASQVVLMTGFGYNPKHTLIKIYKSSKIPCLFKPFNRTKLSETIQQMYEEYNKGLSQEPPPAVPPQQNT